MAEHGRARDDAAALADATSLALPSRDRIADALRRLLPARAAYAVVALEERRARQVAIYQLSRRRPAVMKALAAQGLRRPACRPGYDVDTHFTPRYNPWDQRLCLVPDGDLFRAIRAGTASIVTDTIDTFTETRHPAGVRRRTAGRHRRHRDRAEPAGRSAGMRADASTAARSTCPSTVAYKGMMLSGVPNFALAIGYTNASWTLKVDLVASTCAGC